MRKKDIQAIAKIIAETESEFALDAEGWHFKERLIQRITEYIRDMGMVCWHTLWVEYEKERARIRGMQ